MREHEIGLIEDIAIYNTMVSNPIHDDAAYSISLEKQREKVDQAFARLQGEPLGAVSLEFLKNPTVISYLRTKSDKNLNLWYFIQTNTLIDIEKKINRAIAAYRNDLFWGIGMPPKEFYSSTLIHSVYLSGNTELIDLFKKNLPIPNADVFKGHEIPTEIAENKTKIEQSIKRLRERSPELTLEQITDKIIKIQRLRRARLRRKEEINRIKSRLVLSNTIPEALIQDANEPYRPQCKNQMLAERIMCLSKQVRLFSTVKHWTSGDHIENIFNNILYGRRNLLVSSLPFRPASLHGSDIMEGDGNVICFGPSAIDPRAMQENTIEILFDLEKLSANNPTIFFKQLDLGFALDKQRSVSIRGKQLFFSHTNDVNDERPGFSYLSAVYNGQWDGPRNITALPNYSLISYNVQEIHQILTLNFFRFLDSKRKRSKSIKDELYADLETLTDDELLPLLENIGRQLSDTSEFNIYGAHRIDFSSVIALSSYPEGKKPAYTINLKELIESLEHNDLSMLDTAKANIPGAFRSYRFLDYLLSQTNSDFGRDALLKLRSKCTTPSWVEPVAAISKERRVSLFEQKDNSIKNGTSGNAATTNFF